ncbi:MAG: MBOAT family protein [Alphaproteobacteria bacterium]|nr:MBOAT family protein [Alphaproteobacteria bacterium]
MLFNSYIFLLVFMPLTLGVFFLARRFGRWGACVGLLIAASWAFYAWWSLFHFAILIVTLVANYYFGAACAERPKPEARVIAIVGICLNLGILGFFKYWDFLAGNMAEALGLPYEPLGLLLPLGISFYTFQQIAYVADCYASRSHERSFSQYALFVSFFPQLVAGPIVHHSYMRPQFAALTHRPLDPVAPMLGLVVFCVGLGKKVLIADNLAPIADLGFRLAEAGHAPDMGASWVAALAYSFQIYFDFSGYSEMAIGLGLLFGLKLPLNFDTPYRSLSIIEFWRRWHITLSTWLRDYIYIPLGGNRRGEISRLQNIFVTMLLGGIWHGAGWTFVIWGFIHASLITANHLMRAGLPALDRDPRWLPPAAKMALTFLLVTLAWVFFRAESVGGALTLLSGMTGGAPGEAAPSYGMADLLMVALAALLAFRAPPILRLIAYDPHPDRPLARPRWLLGPPAAQGAGFAAERGGVLLPAASVPVAIASGMMLALVIALIWRPQIFIYFNF